MGDWTGTVPTFTAGAKYRGVDAQTLADVATALTGAFTTWTPTFTNLTVGSGTLQSNYRRLDKVVDFRLRFVFGAGSSVGTSPTFTLPVAPSSDYALNECFIGYGYVIDTGTGSRQAGFIHSSSGILQCGFWNATPTFTPITATAPMTWATGDSLTAYGTYYTA